MKATGYLPAEWSCQAHPDPGRLCLLVAFAKRQIETDLDLVVGGDVALDLTDDHHGLGVEFGVAVRG